MNSYGGRPCNWLLRGGKSNIAAVYQLFRLASLRKGYPISPLHHASPAFGLVAAAFDSLRAAGLVEAKQPLKWPSAPSLCDSVGWEARRDDAQHGGMDGYPGLTSGGTLDQAARVASRTRQHRHAIVHELLSSHSCDDSRRTHRRQPVTWARTAAFIRTPEL